VVELGDEAEALVGVCVEPVDGVTLDAAVLEPLAGVDIGVPDAEGVVAVAGVLPVALAEPERVNETDLGDALPEAQ
jgi:hypothetical protein